MALPLSHCSWDDYPLSLDTLVDSMQAQKRFTQLNTQGGVCSYYLNGQSCIRSSHCPFKHHRTPQLLVCKHYLRGLCKKGDCCDFVHQYDLSRMPTCQFFLAYGECGNPDCNFLHVKQDAEEEDCDDYTHGFCPLGVKCERTHKRAVVCAAWLAGFCASGLECDSAHPKFELDGGKERRRAQAKQREKRQQMMLAADADRGMTEDGRGYFTERVTYKMAHQPKQTTSIASITCNICHQQGHFAAACPQRTEGGMGGGGMGRGRSMDDVQCFRCGERGHYANVCQNPKRAPPEGGYQMPNKRPRF